MSFQWLEVGKELVDFKFSVYVAFNLFGIDPFNTVFIFVYMIFCTFEDTRINKD